MTSKRQFDLATIVCISLVSGVHLLFVNCLPYFLPVLGRAHALSEIALGDIAAMYSFGTAAATLSSPWWLDKGAIRGMAALQLSFILLGLAAVPGLETPSWLIAAFLLIGIGAGGLYALAISILGLGENPVRSYGVKVALGSVPGMACLSLFPMIFKGDALLPIFSAVGIVVTLLCLGVFKLPARLRLPDIAFSAPGTALPIWIALLALTLYMSGCYMLWPFLGLIGERRGLSEILVGQILALSTMAATGAALLAAIYGQKVDYRYSLISALLVTLIGLGMILALPGKIGLAAGVILFIGPSGFILPLMTGFIAHVDIGARRVGLSAAAITLAAGIGPAIGGRIMAQIGFAAVEAMGAIVIAIGVVIQLFQWRSLKRESAAIH